MDAISKTDISGQTTAAGSGGDGGFGRGGGPGGGFGRGGGGPGAGPGGLGMLAIDMRSRSFTSGSVLLVTDMLHPIEDLPVQRFLNRDMCHCSGWACAMPMLL